MCTQSALALHPAQTVQCLSLASKPAESLLKLLAAAITVSHTLAALILHTFKHNVRTAVKYQISDALF